MPDTPPPPSLPRLIGHRGAAAHAPENTIEGLEAAARFGLDWVEVDLRLTADGALVLFHDDRLGRTAPGRAKLRRTTLDALGRLNAGGWFGPSFAGARIPSFAAAAAACDRLGLSANLEIKADLGFGPATAEALAAALDRHWPPDRPLLVSSFDRAALATFARLRPRVPVGFLAKRLPRGWRPLCDGLGAVTVHLAQEAIDETVVREVGATGRPLLAYTVNEPDRAATLFALGVAAVFTDDPPALAPPAPPAPPAPVAGR